MLDGVLEDDQVEAAAQVFLRFQVQDIAIHYPGVFLLQRPGRQLPSPFQSGATPLHPHTFAAPVQEGPQHAPFAAGHLQYPGPGWQRGRTASMNGMMYAVVVLCCWSNCERPLRWNR